ncbi:YceH family protein [Lysobacter sp. 2RAF19]
MSTEPSASPFPVLNALEARILGCLIEKQATTPEQYPLTENAIQLACNQKTNREPIMEVSPGDVAHAVRRMEERRLVRNTQSARALRFEHKAAQVYSLTPQQLAIIAILLLRGPQTPSEIRTRTNRMATFADQDDLQHALDRLQQKDAPMIVRVPRSGGQREDRYMHLLCGPVDVEALRPAASAESASGGASLGERVAELEARVEALERVIERLDRSAGA